MMYAIWTVDIQKTYFNLIIRIHDSYLHQQEQLFLMIIIILIFIDSFKRN